MRILVTGGAGFIGSHLAESLLHCAKVRVLDNFRTGDRRNLTGLNLELIEGSILDRATVVRAMRDVDYVFHLAAFVSVAESFGKPRECAEINVEGLLNVLEEAAVAGVRKLCFASSAAVYGDEPTVPKHEGLQPDPRSPYAATKLDGEHYCRQYSDTGRLETVALRFFNVFGPRQNPAGPYGAAIPVFFREAMAGRPLVIYGDGHQTRDFIHVRDITSALEFTAFRPGLTGVFNAGYGGQVTVLEVARQIIDLTGSRSLIKFGPPRPGDLRHSRASIDRLRRAGWQPGGTLESGLAAYAVYLSEGKGSASSV
jgi:UDP-glucose 4-epimerase